MWREGEGKATPWNRSPFQGVWREIGSSQRGGRAWQTGKKPSSSDRPRHKRGLTKEADPTAPQAGRFRLPAVPMPAGTGTAADLPREEAGRCCARTAFFAQARWSERAGSAETPSRAILDNPPPSGRAVSSASDRDAAGTRARAKTPVGKTPDA